MGCLPVGTIAMGLGTSWGTAVDAQDRGQRQVVPEYSLGLARYFNDNQLSILLHKFMAVP